MFCFQDLLGAVMAYHGNTVRSRDFGRAAYSGDFVASEQTANTAGQLRDNLVFTRDHSRHVHTYLTRSDAMKVEVFFGLEVFVRRVEKCLRRDTTYIETGASVDCLTFFIQPLLYTGRIKTELRGTNRCHIACRARADDHYVVVVRHFIFLKKM